jgi:hypothetical protein
MEINRLRSIIRESISNNLKEIEDVAENAAMEAKLNAYTEAIDKVNKKIEMAESLEEMQELVDPTKLNELKKHLKTLEKSKEKLEKVKAKKNKGKEVVTDEPMEEADVEEGNAMDSMDNAIVPEMDYTMEEVDLSDEEKEELRKKAEQNPSQALHEAFLKMQKLAGVITESQYNEKKSLIENQLNEDILELKQMAKQLYSFLKSEGYFPKLSDIKNEKIKTKVGEDSSSVALIQVDNDKNMVSVAVSPWSAAHSIIGNKPDWLQDAEKRFGNNTERWSSNPEILNHINKLGEKLSQQIKSKYPNMLYKFRREDNFWYIMDFGYGQTKKGGQFNPNDPKNKLA